MELKAAKAKAATTLDKKISHRKVKSQTSFLKKVRKNKTLLLMTLPVIIFFFIFSYLPMPGIYLAFIKYNYGDGILKSPFVGFENFRFLARSGQLATITINTVLYNIAFILLGNSLQILVAVLLNEVNSSKFKKVTQTIMFLPYFISAVIVGLLVYNILNYDYGYLNAVLKNLNMEPVSAYSTPGAWPFIIVLTNLWQGVGYGSIVYFAQITSIGHVGIPGISRPKGILIKHNYILVGIGKQHCTYSSVSQRQGLYPFFRRPVVPKPHNLYLPFVNF
jgi:ABC-type polysaccharide transport system permease subunit